METIWSILAALAPYSFAARAIIGTLGCGVIGAVLGYLVFGLGPDIAAERVLESRKEKQIAQNSVQQTGNQNIGIQNNYYRDDSGQPKNVGELRHDSKVLYSNTEPSLFSTFEIGNSTSIISAKTINFFGSQLKIASIDGVLKVTTRIYDEKGEIIADLVENEWKISPYKSFDRNYTNNALEVLDNSGNVVLQVVLLADRIQLQGEWRGAGGSLRLVAAKDSQGDPVGQFVLSPPGPIPLDAAKIEPIFRYPSDTHFGEMRKGSRR